MKRLIFAIFNIILFALAALLIPWQVHAEDVLDQQQKALDMIDTFAGKLCNDKDVSYTGRATELELTGSAKAELKGLVSKLAKLGFGGAAKHTNSYYEGLLQSDLAVVRKDTLKCHLQIWKDLKDKLLTNTNESILREFPIPEQWTTFHVINCCDIEQPAGWTYIGHESSDNAFTRLSPPPGTEASKYGIEIWFSPSLTIKKKWFESVVPDSEKPDLKWRNTARILRPENRELVTGFRRAVSDLAMWHRSNPSHTWGTSSMKQIQKYCDLDVDAAEISEPIPAVLHTGNDYTEMVLAINEHGIWGSDWNNHEEELRWSYVSCGAPTKQFERVRMFCDIFFSRLRLGSTYCAE